MPFFDGYERYRDAAYSGEGYQPDPYLGAQLSESERERMEERLKQTSGLDSQKGEMWLEHDGSVAGGGVGRLRFADSLIDAYAQVAYMRTDDHFRDWREGPVYPDDHTILDKFSIVAPEEKYCTVDMEFAQRLYRLKIAALLANPQRYSALTDAFEVLEDSHGPLGDLIGRVQDMCKVVREAEHAAKVGSERMTSGLMEKGTQQLIAQSGDIQTLDRYYTALEYVAGLRQGQPTEEVLETAQSLGIPSQLVSKPAPQVQLSSLDVEFQDFDHMVQQRIFSHPRNWGRRLDQLPEEPKDAKALSAYISRYASATVNTVLDVLYMGKESQTMSPLRHTRGTMVVVDGMTVEERMADEYQRMDPPKPDYDQWYAQNVREKTGAYVAAGLMTGKRVEVYVPDVDGRLVADPVRLVPRGYSPSAKKPVTMEAWEWFFKSVGFFNEKEVDQVKADRLSMEAKERVQAHYTASQIADMDLDQAKYKKMFFGPHLQGLGQGGHGFYVGACIAIMVAQGIPIEDIMDPDVMWEEKLEVGRMLLDCLSLDPKTGRPGTSKETRLVWMCFAGQQELIHQVNQRMQRVDLRDPKQMEHVMPMLRACGQVLSQIIQEVRHDQVMFDSYATMAGAWAMELPQEAGQAQMKKADEVASTLLGITEGHQSRTALATCNDEQIGSHLRSCLQEKIYLDKVAQTPGKRFSDRVPDQQTCRGIREGLEKSQGIEDLSKAIRKDRGTKKVVSQMAQAGSLADEVTVRIATDHKGEMKLEAKPSTRLMKAGAPTVSEAVKIPQPRLLR